MAGINRYTKFEPAKYNPRTLQETMLAPAYMRQQHDTVSEQISGTEALLAQIDPLNEHGDLAKQEQQKLYDKLTTQAETLNQSGFNSTSKSDFLRLNKEYQAAVGPTGSLGKIASAKEAMKLAEESYISNSTKLGYSPEDMALNWRDHRNAYIEEFNKTGEVKDINKRYSPNYFNVVDEIEKRFKAAGATGEDVSNLTSKIITKDPRGIYILNEGYKRANSSNATQLQAAVDWMNNQLSNPKSEIGKSMKEQRLDADTALNQVEGLNKVYLKEAKVESGTKTISNFSPASTLGIMGINQNLNHEATEAETIKIKLNSFANKLNKVRNKEEASTGDDWNKLATYGYSGSIPKNSGVATLENQFSTEELEEYNNLASKIIVRNGALNGLSTTDPRVMEAVETYINNNQNITRQNFIITDDFVTNYGDNSIGVNKTDPKRISELVKSSRQYRKYFVDGKVVNYDDLDSEIKSNFNNLSYVGYYSPKNFLTDAYGVKENRNMFISPIAMNYVDDNGKVTEILVSRSNGEMKKPAFKADDLFNRVFVNTNKYPGLPYKVPGDPRGAEVIYFPNGVKDVAPGANPAAQYIVNVKDENGSYNNPVFMTESELQSNFYRAFGVIFPSEVKKKK